MIQTTKQCILFESHDHVLLLADVYDNFRDDCQDIGCF